MALYYWDELKCYFTDAALDDDKKEKLRKWRDLVNMSVSELEKFMESEEGKAAGLSRSEASKAGIRSGRDSARAIIRMKQKKPEEWTAADWGWAGRQISFISRMRGNDGPLTDPKTGEKTRKLTSLLIWGHDPRK